MNCSAYLFGALASGYVQYPDASSADLLRSLLRRVKAPAQVVVRRVDNLMYYNYICRLDEGKSIGLGVVVNGRYVTNVEALFSCFEGVVQKMAYDGEFVCYKSDGNLTSTGEAVKVGAADVDGILANIRAEFEALQNDALPPVNYAIAKDSVKEFSRADANSEVISATHNYGYTFIFNPKDFNDLRPGSYASVLNRVNEENQKLREENVKLKDENARVLRQKKQFGFVVILLIVVAMVGVTLLSTRSTLESKSNQLEETSSLLASKTETLTCTQNEVKSLRESLARSKKEVEDQKETAQKFKEQAEQAEIAKETAEQELVNLKVELALARQKAAYSNQPFVTMRPKVRTNVTAGSVTVDKVVVSSERTEITLTFNNKTAYATSCYIKKDTYISANGKSYSLEDSENIEIAPAVTYVGTTRTFTLYFPRIPSSVSEINLVEPGSDWQFYGIKLR